MGRAFLLLLLLGQVSSLHYPLRDYHYIDIYTTWDNAREYCKENYDDIAMFDSMEDIQLLSKPEGFSAMYAWVGLVDDPAHWKPHMGNSSNSWVWSATGKHSRTGYHNFDQPSEPNNLAAKELCVKMNPQGKWRDALCAATYTFVCFTGNGSEVSYKYVPTRMSWGGAVQYCREHHTDLVMIEDEATNTQIFNMTPTLDIWIGLNRRPWHWANGSPVQFNNWLGGAPNNRGAQYCVVETDLHQWWAVGCTNSNPFICQTVPPLINKVNVAFQSSTNLTDPEAQAQLLRQLEAELRARGYTVRKLEFSNQPRKKK